jgi:hypothetical protein
MTHYEEIYLKVKTWCPGKNFLCPSGFNETASGRYVAVLGYCVDDEIPKTQKSFCETLGNIIGSPYCNQKLKELNGSYAGVVICPSQGEIHVISDRWGTRPLFYIQIK